MFCFAMSRPGALDVHTGVLVLEVIERVNRELGTTTAVITHNAVIAEMADRVDLALRRKNRRREAQHHTRVGEGIGLVIKNRRRH